MATHNGGIGRREFIKRTAFASAALSVGQKAFAASSPVSLERKDLVFVENVDLPTMDPHMITSAVASEMVRLVSDGLVTWDKEMNVIPVLATKWEIGEDKKAWTFHLRPNVKFSNGVPLTSKAVQFTFERLADPATRSPQRSQYSVIERVETPDDLTARIVTKVPYPDLLTLLAPSAASILEPSHTKKYPVKDYSLNAVGSGPYMLKEWISGDKVVFIPNPHYWGPPAMLRSIIFKPVPEAAARTAMIRTGEADIVVTLPPEAVDSLKNDPNVNVVVTNSMGQIAYDLNVENPPLNNKLVRQALNHAVDKEAIVQHVLKGLGTVTNSPLSPGVQYRATFAPYKYDPERAKKLLAEAGHPNGFKLTLWGVFDRYVKGREVTEAIQSYLQAVGVQAEMRAWEWAPYSVASIKDPSRQAVFYLRTSPGADQNISRLFSKSAIGQFNTSNFTHPKVEELLPKARVSFDEKERTELYRQMQAIIWEEAPSIFLYSQKSVAAVRKNVEGFYILMNTYAHLANVVKK